MRIEIKSKEDKSGKKILVHGLCEFEIYRPGNEKLVTCDAPAVAIAGGKFICSKHVGNAFMKGTPSFYIDGDEIVDVKKQTIFMAKLNEKEAAVIAKAEGKKG